MAKLNQKMIDLMDATKPQMIELDKLIPYKYNSKKHSEEHIQHLMSLISEQGLVKEVTVDKDMIIIGGHGRVEACKRLGMKYVRIKIFDFLSKKAANILRITDNRSASEEYDMEKVKLEIQEIDVGNLEDIDIKNMGFSTEEISKLFDDYNVIDDSALTRDLDQDIDDQIKEAEKDIERADEKTVSVAIALGFKAVPIASSRHIAKFIAGLQDEYGLSPEEAFVKFVKDMNEAN